MAAWKTDTNTIPLHTVLIVSDQPNSVAAWDALFSQRICIVLNESSPQYAIQAARLVAPSLVLVDIQLTRDECVELIGKLRKASTGPILLLVSASTAQLALEANLSSADEYLTKPVNPAMLVVKAMARLGHGQRWEHFSQASINPSVQPSFLSSSFESGICSIDQSTLQSVKGLLHEALFSRRKQGRVNIA